MHRLPIGTEIPTSLGVPIQKKEEDLFWIDLSQIRIFWGLSILSRTLGDEIVDRVRTTPGDISFVHKINPNINSELSEMHIGYIQIHARAGVLSDVLLFREEFQDHLRSVFGTFQRQVWAKIIHPEFYGENPQENSSRALVFPFHHASPNEMVDYQFILERVENQVEPGEFLFRLTIENSDRAKIDLASIPHVLVEDLESRIYIAGSTKISESIHSSVIGACQKGERKLIEENRRFNRVFEQIQKTALGSLTEINFFWDKTFSDSMLEQTPQASLPIFKKLFLILEDQEITRHLKEGYIVCARIGKMDVYIDLSRLDRVLNYSFNARRHSANLGTYLRRMPELAAIAEAGFESAKGNLESATRSFRGIHIFLIHHITSEILATLESFRRLGAESVSVAFVKYGGTIPPVYLDVLLDLPTDSFYMCGLELKVGADRKTYYSVSPLFSDTHEIQDLKDYLDTAELGFFPAMKLLATHVFLKRAIHAYTNRETLLLVEDGGYIAPFLNQFALDGATLSAVCAEYRLDSPGIDGRIPFGEFLSQVLVGSVEHTRNGYDRLLSVAREKHCLFLPAYSIAISHQKVKEESQEVAHSILKATEDILHGQGKILSRRKFLVLGSAGNIGTFLCRYLRNGRLHETNKHLLEVDIKYPVSTTASLCYHSFSEIPEPLLLDTDFILGVIGESILTAPFWENLILNGTAQNLYLASGSTKTVEFTHFIEWLNGFLTGKSTHIGTTPVEVESHRILDPQSQMDQGGHIIFRFPSPQRSTNLTQTIQPPKDSGSRNATLTEKHIFLLSDLSPVNFLYYGAPTEIMDSILSQLVSVSLGMVDQFRKGTLPKPHLYAVDHEIDVWGNPL